MLHPMPTHEQLKANILGAWRASSKADKVQGKVWYQTGHDILHGMAHTYGIRPAKVTGIAAVLSPSVSWDRNILEAGMILDGHLDGFTAYGPNVAKAWDILHDDNYGVIRGPKVGPFYQLLLNPHARLCVVDSWAIRIAVGIQGGVRGYNSVARIPKIQRAYFEVARKLRIKTSHLQATTWLYIREV